MHGNLFSKQPTELVCNSTKLQPRRGTLGEGMGTLTTLVMAGKELCQQVVKCNLCVMQPMLQVLVQSRSVPVQQHTNISPLTVHICSITTCCVVLCVTSLPLNRRPTAMISNRTNNCHAPHHSSKNNLQHMHWETVMQLALILAYLQLVGVSLQAIATATS